MGFLGDVFLGPKCMYCGERSLKTISEFGYYERTKVKIFRCSSCARTGVYNFIPRCSECGERQTSLGRNEYDVIVPKCPNCGHLWDDDDPDRYK